MIFLDTKSIIYYDFKYQRFLYVRNNMLKLIKLELEGFACFKNKTEFLYEDGINVILAENGSGKTTQINAISILLLSEYEGSFADYMNRECNEFTISLEFMLNDKHLLETL